MFLALVNVINSDQIFPGAKFYKDSLTLTLLIGSFLIWWEVWIKIPPCTFCNASLNIFRVVLTTIFLLIAVYVIQERFGWSLAFVAVMSYIVGIIIYIWKDFHDFNERYGPMPPLSYNRRTASSDNDSSTQQLEKSS